MFHSKTESLHFYKYLCQKIGSETIVRARRLIYISEDFQDLKFFPNITSGSRGEGLDLKGSDTDIMKIDPGYVVYESDNDIAQDWRRVLIMDTEDAPPCFTQLRLHTNVNNLPPVGKQQLQQHRGKTLLSSELYKSQILRFMQVSCTKTKFDIHGPCLSDCNYSTQSIDMALCLKCDQWVSQAQPWISRSRSIWPTSELISKITSCGTLFVPIGNKGSTNENLQWRISFSVAEKILIYSFSHTQLLCYALLKILLKEIVSGKDELKDLICSYFLKTLMFWMSEENDTSVWRPDTIIPCFMACLKRLLYCIEYSTLLHYFIPNNNLFFLRFTNKQTKSLINILMKSYQKGIHIFSSSQTLHDYRKFSFETSKTVSEISRLMKTIIDYKMSVFKPSSNILGILNTLLHHCKTELSKAVFKISTARKYQVFPILLPHVNNPNNTQQYKFYKHQLSHLLVGVYSDSISGWLKLASFFYGHKNYLTSIDIINYALSKCTYDSSLSKIAMKQKKKLKLISLIPFPHVIFCKFNIASCNAIIPLELQSPHDLDVVVFFNSNIFAHFLRFLCCYHLHDLKTIQSCMNTLLETVSDYTPSIGDAGTNVELYHYILLGIAFQMLGEPYLAKKHFFIAAQNDPFKISSAAFRLRQLC